MNSHMSNYPPEYADVYNIRNVDFHIYSNSARIDFESDFWS